MGKGAIWVILSGLALLPVWRCGMRYNLSFYEFIIEHTIFSGHEVMYLPEELLTKGDQEGIYLSPLEVGKWRG